MTTINPTAVPLDGYYNRPTDDLWWAIFTRDNPSVDYEQNQVRVSQMLVNDDGDTLRNTKGKLIAIPGMGREGEEWLTWNRPYMEEIFKDKEVWVKPNGQTTLSEVVEGFNTIWKFQLTPRDYYDQNIELFDAPQVVEVKMRDTCLCFQGTLTINVGVPLLHIGEHVINRDLAGVDYPTHQYAKPQAPFYVWERNFTFIGKMLRDEFGYDDLISQDQLTILNNAFMDTWVLSDTTADWNLKEARVVYNGTTDTAPAPVNTAYERVIMIEVSDVLCNNFYGHLTLHYNVLTNY